MDGPELDPDYLRDRLRAAFRRRSVLAAWGIQYRLSEVGQSRLDPRLLSQAIGCPDAEQHPLTRLVRGLHADPREPAATLSEAADQAFSAARDVSTHSAPLDAKDVLQALGFSRSALRSLGDVLETRPLADNLQLTAQSSILHWAGPVPIRIWFTNDPRWLYPDDPRVWRLTVEVLSDDRPTLIVARKIAPATFHLFKTLGIRGVQYYSMLAADPPTAPIAASHDLLGLPRTMGVSDLSHHAVGTQLRSNLAVAADTFQAAAKQRRLLRSVSEVATAQQPALLEWSVRSGLTWPDAWEETLRRWQAYGAPVDHDWATHGQAESPIADANPRPTQGSDSLRQSDGLTKIYPHRVAAEVDRETWDMLRNKRPHTA